ncbi:MAG: M23 family metallopeptidase [Bacteroidales bacterium]|jgi:murein DD-endopeptidase MepM/ murein hydrolase activator NlpD|nr:M23 family metallopeptidase [Bacteroidales bacterium]MBR6160784.1 M23 family metallopeptidase [Bacteroidales bacterium]
MPNSFYHFNPKTLSFEKVKVSFKHIFKRLVWVFFSGVAFAVVFVWIAFYTIDSPKVKILERENNELRGEVENLSHRLDILSDVLADIEDRDDNVYRTVFEADPVPASERYPLLLADPRFDSLSRSEAYAELKEANMKADQLVVRLAAQSRSLSELEQIASKKSDMLSSIPAIRPLKNMHTITSGFGRRYHPILKTLRAHTGVDITAPKGTPVYATADGTVSGDNPGSGYGIAVLINHGYSYQTLYAHLSKKAVKPGQKVKRGQLIGYVGSTGMSSGSHLHYEVIKNGTPVNPVYYFNADITPEEYNSILESSKKVNQALS